MNFFQKFREFISQPTHKRTLGIVIMLVLAAAVSLTVVLSQQQQTIRQRAAVSAEQLAKGYVLCGDGLKCENNIKVDTPDKFGFNKCLSTTYFRGADIINGKYLTRCNSDLYYEDGNNNNVCSLVPGSNPSETTCTPPQPLTPEDYVFCGSGLECNGTTVEATDCLQEGETGKTKCLSTGTSFHQDQIAGRSLACCNTTEYRLVNDKCTLVADGEYSSPTCNPESRILPTLSIDPTSINEGGDLNFSFTGFDPDEQVTVIVVGGGSITVKAGSDSNGKSLIPGLTEPAGKYTLKATGGSSGQFATEEFEIIATPILNIDPVPITTGGNLKYSFSGFQPDEIIEVWVNKRGESGSDNKTGGIVNPTATNGSGNSIIYGLTEPAGEYTLSAKGVSSERFTTAEFDISSSAHVLPKLNTTTPVPAPKLTLPPTSVPATDRAHDLSAFNSSPTITPFVEPCRFKNKGDANCDDKITIIDFNIWKEEFTGAKTTKTADFNGDNKISITDFNVWKGGFTDASLQH